jgi:hypothetical protein
MATTVNPNKARSWSELAASIYPTLNNDKQAARPAAQPPQIDYAQSFAKWKEGAKARELQFKNRSK